MSRTMILLVVLGLGAGPAVVRGQAGTLGDNAALQYYQAINNWMSIATILAQGPKASLEERFKQIEEIRKAVDNYRTTPLDKQTVELVTTFTRVPKLVHRGAAMRHCDWGIDYSDGPNTLLPHAQYIRPVTRFMCLRARYALSRQQDGAAIDDLGDVLVVARHVGTDKPVVLLLIQDAIENQAIQVLADHLVGLDPSALRRLGARLDALPESAGISQRLLWERDNMLGWLRRIVRTGGTAGARHALIELVDKLSGPDGLGTSRKAMEAEIDQATGRGVEHLSKLIDETARLYDEQSRMVSLPLDQFQRASAAYMEKLKTANPVAKVFLGVPSSWGPVHARYAAAQAEARLAMLRAAIAIVLKGPGQVGTVKDPFGAGPFGYQPRGAGFELTSKLMIEGKPFTMTFRGASRP